MLSPGVYIGPFEVTRGIAWTLKDHMSQPTLVMEWNLRALYSKSSQSNTALESPVSRNSSLGVLRHDQQYISVVPLGCPVTKMSHLSTVMMRAVASKSELQSCP
jgi:hypothetical protein